MILRLEGTEHLWTLTLSLLEVLFLVRGWDPRACPRPDLCQAAWLAQAEGGAKLLRLPASRRDNNGNERGGAGARPRFFGPFALWPLASPRPQACYFPFLRGLGNVIPKLPGS